MLELGRFFAFVKSHRLDSTSSGHGVRQFKTALLQRLKRENETTLAGRGAKSDAREMQRFYQDFYKKYIQDLQNAADKHDRAQLTKAYQTASVLFEVLKAIEMSIEVKLNTLQAHAKVEEKKQLYKPYNILPLDPDSENQAIMRYPEIQASVSALRNIRGLPWPKDDQKKVNEDILDWLQAMFGFQKDNVENQREHLILLLANVHIRQFPKPNQQPKFDDRALTEVMKKLFKNYKRWCKYLDRKSSLWLPTIQQEVQQRKLLYMGLYLLIWGEASNLRFMPECLCYIYHHMAFELYGMLDGRVSPMTGEPVKPVYGGDDEAFLKKVVTPIYETIAKEAKRRRGKAKHSQWRNYDDLNEYFWSVDCFRLGWPMRADADFFCQPLEKLRADKKSREQCTGPTEMKRKCATPGLKRYPNSHYLGEEELEKRNIRLGESDIAYTFQKSSNSFGQFILLTEFKVGGSRRSVIIPKGRAKNGWRVFGLELRKMLESEYYLNGGFDHSKFVAQPHKDNSGI
nr:callose synthase 2-like [Quercus suber]